jgi:hypothetical protein
MGEAVAKYIIQYLSTGSAVTPPPMEAKLIMRKSTAPPAQVRKVDRRNGAK